MVKNEARRSANAESLWFLFFENQTLSFRYVQMVPRVQAFLKRRHKETLSSVEFTLCQSTNRYTGELFSSVSSTVRRQSSMASFMAVTTMMTIRGTVLRAGLSTPNIEKN